jgi:ankyrin repeat protein
MSDLFDAISRGDGQAVEAALAAGAKVNEKQHGQNPFEAAMRAKQPAIARRLLQSGADARKAVSYLCAAIQLGDPVLVRALLDAGADPNMDPPGGRPLQFAVKARSPEIVRLLIEAGADVNAGSSISTPLADAIERDEEECAFLLIEAGAQGDGEVPSQPPIASAVYKGQARVVEAMLKHGASPHCRGTITKTQRGQMTVTLGGDTIVMDIPLDRAQVYTNAPLVHIAAGEGYAELVQLLLDAAADPTEVDDDGQTALAIAERNDQKETAGILRASGGDASAKIAPELALLIAARAGDAKGVQAALAQDANVNAQDSRRETLGMRPLMLAAANGHLEIVRQLLDAGADVNATDDIPGQQRPPGLAFAYREGGMEAVEHMGVTLGRTALMCAAEQGHVEIVTALISAGADLHAQDAVKETALTLAKEEKQKAVVAALLDAGASSKPARSKTAKAKAKPPKAAKSKKKAPTKAKTPRAKKVSAKQLKQYERDAVLNRLAEKADEKGFQRIVKRLADQCGAKPVPLGDEAPFGYSIHVNARKRIEVEAVQDELLSEGAFVFAAESDGKRIDRIAVIPSDDKYDALAAMETNGANLGLEPRDVIRWLMELEQEQPFAITGVAFDWVDGYFTAPIADPEGLAKRMYKFCPDIVEQGVGDVASLTEMLRQPQPRLYFWWD